MLSSGVPKVHLTKNVGWSAEEDPVPFDDRVAGAAANADLHRRRSRRTPWKDSRLAGQVEKRVLAPGSVKQWRHDMWKGGTCDAGPTINLAGTMFPRPSEVSGANLQ